MIIAIDGPAASGKGTLGKRLAKHYGYRHLDTGVIYRAVAKALLDAGHSPDDAALATEAAVMLDPAKFEDNALKLQAITEAASPTSWVFRAGLPNFSGSSSSAAETASISSARSAPASNSALATAR